MDATSNESHGIAEDPTATYQPIPLYNGENHQEIASVNQLGKEVIYLNQQEPLYAPQHTYPSWYTVHDTIDTNPVTATFQEPYVLFVTSTDQHNPPQIDDPTGEILDLDSKQILNPTDDNYGGHSNGAFPAYSTPQNNASQQGFYYMPDQLQMPHFFQINTAVACPPPTTDPQSTTSTAYPLQYHSMSTVRDVVAQEPPNPISHSTTKSQSKPAPKRRKAKTASVPAEATQSTSFDSIPKTPVKSRKRKAEALITPELEKKLRGTPRRSNEKKLKTYFCNNCDKWFTTVSHLRRHFRTPLHTNFVAMKKMIDAALLPTHFLHYPDRFKDLADHEKSDETSSHAEQPRSMERDPDYIEDDSEPPQSESDADTSFQSIGQQPSRQMGASASKDIKTNFQSSMTAEDNEPNMKQIMSQEESQNSQEVIEDNQTIESLDCVNPFQDSCQQDTVIQIDSIVGNPNWNLIDTRARSQIFDNRNSITATQPAYRFNRQQSLSDLSENSGRLSTSTESLDAMSNLPPTEYAPWNSPSSSSSSDDEISFVSPPHKRRRVTLLTFSSIFPHSNESRPWLTEPPQKIKCNECDKEFSKPCYLTQHKNARHSTKNQFGCKVCGKRFPSERLCAAHLARHGATKKDFQCPLCPRQYFHLSDLRRHIGSHAPRHAYTCEICEKGFARRDHLEAHEKIHSRTPRWLMNSKSSS